MLIATDAPFTAEIRKLLTRWTAEFNSGLASLNLTASLTDIRPQQSEFSDTFKTLLAHPLAWSPQLLEVCRDIPLRSDLMAL
jgi:hypothetical protein